MLLDLDPPVYAVSVKQSVVVLLCFLSRSTNQPDLVCQKFQNQNDMNWTTLLKLSKSRYSQYFHVIRWKFAKCVYSRLWAASYLLNWHSNVDATINSESYFKNIKFNFRWEPFQVNGSETLRWNFTPYLTTCLRHSWTSGVIEYVAELTIILKFIQLFPVDILS